MPNLNPESVFSMPPALHCLTKAFGGGRLLEIYYIYTVKVDILACIKFRVFAKIVNLAHIYIYVFLILLPLHGIIKVIFTMYKFSQIIEKHE